MVMELRFSSSPSSLLASLSLGWALSLSAGGGGGSVSWGAMLSSAASLALAARDFSVRLGFLHLPLSGTWMGYEMQRSGSRESWKSVLW